MSFVFVSHANPDKVRIRHIVDALIGAGEKLWLDNPAAMGYSDDEIKQHFHRITAGGRWRDEIDEALRMAGAVVVCWSARAKEDREVWQSEATYARVERKLVSCRIDDVDPGELPDDFGAEQMPDLRPDLPGEGRAFGFMPPARQTRPAAELKVLLEGFLRDIRGRIEGRASLRPAGRSLRDPFMPYLINRMDQETAIGRAIEDVAADGGVKPFVIAGPENECLDEFLERLRRHTSPQRLRRGAWHELTVVWPNGTPPNDFGAEFGQRLAHQLGLPGRSNASAIAKTLSERDRPVAVVSLMRAEEWEAIEPKRIRAWLNWWQALGADPNRISVLPILSLTMGAAPPGWTHYPGGVTTGARVSNAQIWRDIQGLQKANGGLMVFPLRAPAKSLAPKVAAPPVLRPVRKGDTDVWLSQCFEMMTVERTEAKAIVDRIFKAKVAAKHGVPLAEFALAVKPLFGAAR